MTDFPKVADTSMMVISPATQQSILHHRTLFVGTASASATWPTANLAIYIPFRIAQPTTIVKIFWQNGTVASGNIDVGIYDLQGNRLVSIGSTAQTGTSAIQTADITDTTLQYGTYYMAMAMDNTTGTIRRWSPAGGALNVRMMGIYNSATSFALPSTATFVGATAGSIPIICLTARVLI